jgi:hypothetical protein
MVVVHIDLTSMLIREIQLPPINPPLSPVPRHSVGTEFTA